MTSKRTGRRASVLLILATLLLGACMSSGGSVAQRRQAVQDMREQVLGELYQEKPDVRAQLQSAPGYAVFSNANVNLFFASVGGGYGIMHDRSTGRDTYLKMGELGVGFGLGVKDFRAVLVFHTADAVKRFQDYGVSMGAGADAAAVASAQGGAIGGELNFDNVTVYQMTESGLALQATLKGTRYWPDPDLN
ncbi:MAG: YSC84-related protein [Pseudohongiellaceae bacterium]|jgi:lipid-binding SYLF domain-containing protein